jgi:aspartyl-tRNA(Asn)/glutamyl-tRNA(Gln) amidotransferase subunit C
MISKEQIKYIAKLSRIKTTPEEIDSLEKDLSDILNYVNKLQELNTDNVELMSESTHIKNITRDDEAKKTDNQKDIIDIFPEKEKNFLKVKPIF